MATEKHINKLSAYSGREPIHEDCEGYGTIDHQVAFVGYGKKDKTDVWVIRNSWGKNWGARGNFYVPIGANSYCTEMYAYAVIPENADFTKRTDRGKQERGFFKWTHLDPDSRDIVENDGSFNGMQDFVSYAARIAIIVVVCVAIVAILLTIICCCCCCCKKRRQRNASGGTNVVMH